MVRLLGIDPGLRFTGWGVIEIDGNRLRHIADGVIATDSATSVPDRLKVLHDALVALMAQHRPDEAAVEETYVNRNGSATLKLGYARGVALLAPALAGVPVTEYAAKSVKLAVVGTGGADKAQVQMMVRRLLPGASIRRADAADALAVAICHAHHSGTMRGPRDRPAHRTRRGAGGRSLHHRCEWCRLPGAGFHPHARRATGAACISAAAGGDACA
jgi:crossover junction endodeoxyribonuclease RuvC